MKTKFEGESKPKNAEAKYTTSGINETTRSNMESAIQKRDSLISSPDFLILRRTKENNRNETTNRVIRKEFDINLT